MGILRKIRTICSILAIKASAAIDPALSTRVAIKIYRSRGMKLIGMPNYISSRVNFDGTDFGLIEIHEGVTISSYVRILTHDWSLYTVAKAVGYFSNKPIGKIRGVVIGKYSFVGTGCIIMPGTEIGQGCIIAAGTVVRGRIPDFSIVAGSPGNIVGDTRNFIRQQFSRQMIEHPIVH